MDHTTIQLGSTYWVVLKTSIVDPAKTRPDFLVHITVGRVTSKGLQLEDDNDGSIVCYVEVAGQRVRADHVFETSEECVAKVQEMMAEMQLPKDVLPEQA